MIQQRATTDDKTIMKVSRNEITQHKAPRRRRTMPKKVIAKHEVKVDSRVMKVARRLAGGDMRRIKIKDAHTVVVANQS